tara:strand:- start:3033 stop:3392 length:360 start_codon:yes stop_codon:yes gene_type:complete
MQKDITKEDYFGTLMSCLVDQSQALLNNAGKHFRTSPTAYLIQQELCDAGCWVSRLPNGPTTMVHLEPQKFVLDLQKKVLPGYRMQAGRLIEHFISSCIEQGGDEKTVKEFFEGKYKWK